MRMRTLLVGLLAVGLMVALVGCGGSKVTKANADKVTEGMTVDEVKDILGTPTKETSVGIGPLKVDNMIWESDDKTITVSFKDGKVKGPVVSVGF